MEMITNEEKKGFAAEKDAGIAVGTVVAVHYRHTGYMASS